MQTEAEAMAESVASTAPHGLGDAPLPKRNGSRGMLPLSWMGQAVRLSYVGAYGEGAETSATLLDWCGAGPVFAIDGARTLVSWDRLVLLELVAD